MLAAENLPWWRHDRPWGFRFSLMDAIIVAGGALLTFAAWPITAGAFTRRVLIGCKVLRPLIELLIGRKLTEFDQEIAIDE